MKVNQISSMLNGIWGEVLGQTGLVVAEDLSNLVDVGRVITADAAFGDNFDNYTKDIIDKVGKTIFVDRVYRAKDLGIWRDSWEYASVLEKIRCDVGEFKDNCEWDLTKDVDANQIKDYNDNLSSHIEELFKFIPAKVQAKYFNLKTTFKTTISITRKQLKSAFNSASEMARFIGMIENRIMSKMEIAKDELQRRTIVNLIGTKIAANKNVVDLKAEFEAAGGTAITTLAEALRDPDFLKFAAKRITQDREFLTIPSTMYTNGTFYNHTPIEDSRLIVLSDLDAGLKFNLYGDTYNQEFVKLDNYKTVPFWQGTGTAMGLLDRANINIKTASSGEADPAVTLTGEKGIIGILFDRDAAMVCNETPEVRSQYNADGNFTNFFYCYDCSYFNDFDENAIIYTWGTAA